MVVVGGSAVGLELAQFFARMGTEITVLEALPRLLPAEDADVGDALAVYLREEGMQIHTGVLVERVSGKPGGHQVEFADARGAHTVQAEQLLVATGRRPNTQGMGLEEVGIRIGKKGEVVVDAHMETTRPGVYAAGDVAGDRAFVYVAWSSGCRKAGARGRRANRAPRCARRCRAAHRRRAVRRATSRSSRRRPPRA
jgi:mercuric reductase